MWGVNGRFGLDWTGSRDSGNEAVSLMVDNEECGHCQTWRGMKKRDKVEERITCCTAVISGRKSEGKVEVATGPISIAVQFGLGLVLLVARGVRGRDSLV